MFEDTYFNEELFVLIFQVKIVCLNVISIYTNRSLDIFFLYAKRQKKFSFNRSIQEKKKRRKKY